MMLLQLSTTMEEKQSPKPRKINKVHAPIPNEKVQVVTTDFIPGYTITKSLGLVSGSSVQMLGLAKGITAGLGQFFSGGDVPDLHTLLEDTRKLALNRLKTKALAAGADAVVGVRLTTSGLGQHMAEVCVYGTAVKISSL